MTGIIERLKLPAPAYRQAGIPLEDGTGTAGPLGKVVSFYTMPLDPAYRAGLAGHVPVN
jgi:hypothetical protein